MMDDDIKKLLPWYVNGTLSEQEQVLVRDLLDRDEHARKEIDFLRALSSKVQSEEITPPSELGWRRLQRDIKITNRQPVHTEGAKANWWKPGIATAAAIVMALQVGILMQQPFTDTSTRLLGQNQTTIQENHWLIQIEFRDESQWQEIVSLIHGIDGTVVNGPSSIGLLRISVPKNNSQFSSTKELLIWFKQQSLINHVDIESE